MTSIPQDRVADPIASPRRPLIEFVFGTDSALRAGLVRTLMAFAVYVLCLLAQWAAVETQHGSRLVAVCMTAVCLGGSLGFFAVIRCGLTVRFDDALLTLPQMVFAIVCVAFACHFNPNLSAMVPIVDALVLVFGAFTLPARRCERLGQFAVLVFGVSTALRLTGAAEMVHPLTEAISFVLIAVVLSTIAKLAGQLSQLRSTEKAQRRTLRDVMERLKQLATEDVLTGLPNRRHIQEWMPHELARMRRGREPLCIALIDLDHFKRINDTFGHAAGDEALRLVARESRLGIRDGDVLARWGGEEFMLVMPATSMSEALVTIDRIRARIELPSVWADFPNSRVTFSAGLTMANPSQTLEEILQWADFALYEAKALGRNRTSVAKQDDPTALDRLMLKSIA